jgi:ABC-type transporter Mla subunit MlaD
MQLMKKKIPSTVNEVMGVFHKTIADLGKVADQHEATSEELGAEREQIDQQILAANQEARRARKVKAQLEAVVTG